MREPFNSAINKLNNRLGKDLYWMFSCPSSRNPYISECFYKFCCLNLLLQIDLKDISIIYVHGSLMKTEVIRLVRNENEKCKVIDLSVGIVSIVKNKFFNIKMIINSSIKIFIPLIVAKFYRRTNHKKIIDGVLLDTFIVPNHIDKDRYFTSLIDNLSIDDAKRCFFVPQYTAYSSLKELINLNIDARKSERQFIFKEDYVNIFELLLKAFAIIFHRFNLPSINVNGIELTNLFKEDLMHKRSFFSELSAWNNYLFFFKLHKKNIQLKTIISWFENQQVDKGWNKGANTFYANTKLKGYKGAVDCDLYLCFQPIESEVKNGYTPKEIGVLGYASLKTKEYAKVGLTTFIAPAFRYQNFLVDYKNIINPTQTKVLICLPIGDHSALNILNMTIPVLNESKIKVLVKKHPVGQSIKWLLTHSQVSMSDNFEWVDGDFHALLKESTIFVGSSSSTCFDAVLMAKNVIIIASTGFSYNYIPEEINSKNYNWVYSQEDFKLSLYKAMATNKEPSRYKLEDYFSPITPESCKKLIT